eukprot:m.59580 g.59580  ORF g.59580 m.59580 type:complete len:287 (-) comp16007_c0_seq2:28-888(-)
MADLGRSPSTRTGGRITLPVFKDFTKEVKFLFQHQKFSQDLEDVTSILSEALRQLPCFEILSLVRNHVMKGQMIKMRQDKLRIPAADNDSSSVTWLNNLEWCWKNTKTVLPDLEAVLHPLVVQEKDCTKHTAGSDNDQSAPLGRSPSHHSTNSPGRHTATPLRPSDNTSTSSSSSPTKSLAGGSLDQRSLAGDAATVERYHSTRFELYKAFRDVILKEELERLKTTLKRVGVSPISREMLLVVQSIKANDDTEDEIRRVIQDVDIPFLWPGKASQEEPRRDSEVLM